MRDLVIWTGRALRWLFLRGECPVLWLIAMLIASAVGSGLWIWPQVQKSPDLANFWGPAYGAALGLFAILVGALVNGIQNRALERWKRKKRLIAIARALQAELISIRRWHAAPMNFSREIGATPFRIEMQDQFVPKNVRELVVFDRNADSFGELPAQVTHDISQAYFFADHLNRSLSRIIGQNAGTEHYMNTLPASLAAIDGAIATLNGWLENHAHLDD